MRKRMSFIVCAPVVIVALCGMAAPAGAALVSVDPDAFAAGTNISNAFAGVTLSSVGPGWSSPSGSIFAVDPSIQIEPFIPSTGVLAFGTDGSFPHLFRELGFLQLRADFAQATSLVSLDFIGNDADDVGVLRAYDAGGGLLDSATTAHLGWNQVGTLTVADPAGKIAYVLAGGDAFDSSLGLDNLKYLPVPEPLTVLTLVGGLASMGAYLRRRRMV